MSFDSLLIDLVDVTNITAYGPAVDRYGDLQETTTTISNVPCRVDPAEGQGGNREVLETANLKRDTRINRFKIFFRADAPVTALSTLTWGTRSLRISADPELMQNSVGVHHMEVEAEEIEG